MQRGRLITLEGIEGAGKSTHIGAICSALDASGIEVIATREPGGTKFGEQLRRLLLSKEFSIGAETELLMLFAARSELIGEVVRPALDKGQWVVSDRFTDSSYAYQGGGRNCPLELLDVLKATVCKEIRPDLTILFDVKAEFARERIVSRGKAEDRFESESNAFFKSVRDTYLQMAKTDPSRWRIVSTDREIDEVQASVLSHVEQLLHEHKGT